MASLYHFTSALHWPLIQESGVIRPTESNISATTTGGPDVVWLLDAPDPTSFDHGLGSGGFKGEIGVEVRVRLAIKWTEWSWTAHMDRDWRDALLEGAGGEPAADHWWVLPGPIRSVAWVRAWNTVSGETLWVPGSGVELNP